MPALIVLAHKDPAAWHSVRFEHDFSAVLQMVKPHLSAIDFLSDMTMRSPQNEKIALTTDEQKEKVISMICALLFLEMGDDGWREAHEAIGSNHFSSFDKEVFRSFSFENAAYA